VVETLAVVDETLAATRHGRRNAIVMLVVVAVIYAAGLVTLAAHDPGAWRGFVFSAVVVYGLPSIAFALVVGRSFVHQLAQGRRPSHPTRWRFVPRSTSRVVESIRGAAGGDARLQAPLSGRACIAWQLGVRREGAPTDPAWTWALLEKDVASGSVDGRAIDPSRCHLDAPALTHEAGDDPVVLAALQRRGIDTTRPGLQVFETLVLAGDAVQLDVHADGSTTLRPLG
jgi:hypothetical protein